jgi:hypothetical protein
MSARSPIALFALLAFGVLSGGCASVFEQTSSTGAAIAGSAAAASVTRNAALATGIGVGVEVIAARGVRALERQIHGEEQAAIAEAAGPLDADSVAGWEVHHAFALEPDERGKVSVTRIAQVLGRTCKEIVFTVESGDSEAPGAFLADICSVENKDGSLRWTWALAEPSTARWGILQ